MNLNVHNEINRTNSCKTKGRSNGCVSFPHRKTTVFLLPKKIFGIENIIWDWYDTRAVQTYSHRFRNRYAYV